MLENLFQMLCFPTDRREKTEGEKKVIYRKNKVLLSTIFLGWIFSIILSHAYPLIPKEIHHLNIGMFTFFLVLLLFTIRSKFWMFSFCYTVIATLYPAIAFQTSGDILFSIYAAYLVPIFILILSDSQTCSWASLFLQILFLNYQVGPEISHLAYSTEVIHLMDSFAGTTVFFAVLLFLVIGIYDSSFKSAVKITAEIGRAHV